MKSIMTVGCKDVVFAIDLSLGDLIKLLKYEQKSSSCFIKCMSYSQCIELQMNTAPLYQKNQP